MSNWSVHSFFSPITMIIVIVGGLFMGWIKGYWDLPLLPSVPVPIETQVDRELKAIAEQDDFAGTLLRELEDHKPVQYALVRERLTHIAYQAETASGTTEFDFESVVENLLHPAKSFSRELVFDGFYETPDDLIAEYFDIEYELFEIARSKGLDSCVAFTMGDDVAIRVGADVLPPELTEKWQRLLLMIVEAPRPASIWISNPSDLNAWSRGQPERIFGAVEEYAAAPHLIDRQRKLCRENAYLFDALKRTPASKRAAMYRGLILHGNLRFQGT